MLTGFNPRLYQETILSTAALKNTLVVLPTGMGKTGIALLLAAQRLKSFPDSKILIIAPTRPLVEQHFNSFKQFLNIPEKEFVFFTGQVPPEKRAELWKSAKIIFSTPQGLENDIISNSISLKQVSLFVFDEAHRAVGDYSYVFLAKQYQRRADWPRILALTASPGSDVEKIQDVCKNLYIESVEIRSENDPDVKPYIQDVDFELIKLDLPEKLLKVKKFLEQCVKSKLSELRKYGVRVPYFSKKELLVLQAKIHAQIAKGNKNFELLKAISILAEIMKAQHALELLETQGVSPLIKYLDSLYADALTAKTKAVKNLTADLNFKSAFILVKKLQEQNIEHPKINAVKDFVVNEIKRDKFTKIILFTQFRDTASKIHEIFKDADILSNVFVGQAKKRNTGLSQKEQAAMLDMFRDGVFNVLISTSLHPNEFIVLKDPENKISIKKIGEFVEANLKNKKPIKGWKALSVDKKRLKFFPITDVHKHKRQSKVVEMKLSSGFRANITEDHSIFSFDKAGKLYETRPKKNLFINLAFSAPNNSIISEIDVVKELLKAPSEDIKNLFCNIKGVSQAKIRMFSSELKFLKTLKKKKRCMEEISKVSKLDPSSVLDVYRRLKDKDFVERFKKGRKKVCKITKKGKEYFNCLFWLFKSYKYHKKKYRLSLKQVAFAPNDVDNFFNICVGVWYGKKTVQRFLKVTPNLAEFLGIYVAEGLARKTKKQSEVYLAGRKKDMQKRMIRTIKSIGFTPSVSQRGVAIHNQIAYQLIKHVFKCGIGTWNKEVPSIIFNVDDKIKWKFLEGYFAGDGYARDSRIVFTTVSRKLAAGLVLLLRQLGIKKITIRKDNCFRVNVYESLPFVKIKNQEGKRNYYSTIPRALTGKAYFEKYKNLYCKKKIGKACRIAKVPKEQTCFDYIQDIKILKKQPKYVYDISVKNTEKFFGGVGLINFHNSVGEEGLDIPKVDIVMFYEPIPSVIRFIQRRGRTGRLEKGRVVIFVTKKTRDEGYLWSAKHKEKKMISVLETLRHKVNNIEIKKQPSLKSFENNVKIFADYREKSTGVVKELVENNINLKLEVLKCADYVLSSRVGVELKTVEDFVDSIVDGRLLEQLKMLKKHFERPIIILQGSRNLYSVRNVHPNAIRGMLATISVSYNIPIISTADEKDTAALLISIAKREQSNSSAEFSPHADKKPMTLKEQQEYIVSAIPNIGPALAKTLLKELGSVKVIFTANTETLTNVPGVGKKIAKNIIKVLHEKYSI